MHTIAAAGGEDPFRVLPDELLRHVLSFLPADDALQTCVLDTRWHDLWRRTTSLILFFDKRSSACSCERFEQLAKLVTSLCGHSPLIKCEINVYPGDPLEAFANTTKLLIDYVLACQTEELTLSPVDVEDIDGLDPPIFDVPLISQHLKAIDLHWVSLEFPGLDFNACPVLEDLKLRHCNIYVREISSKSLKRLCITDFCVVPLDFRIRICAPDLVSLQVDDFDGVTPFLEDMPSLVTAYVGLDRACHDWCEDMHLKGCGLYDCGCHTYPIEGGVLLNGLSNAVNLELIAVRQVFIYTWDLEWCPIFCNLKRLLLNEWFTSIDLVCILQHSPILEMLTLQLGGIKNLTRARGAQKSIEQPFMCAHLKVVNIECDEVDEDIRKILKILWTCGILRDHISIKAPSSPSYFFSFQKDPLPLLPL
ncbi:F-box/FBD/LRR-repeat protein At5g22660-like [Triticum dicoccoides]|uniref:F-box/FBD/LRR-repeat protein At5g22660-like n=1 Tax=Triticum dicoccoides TaxID=85692 RepID=UPI000E7C50ED|nr:F-box/FBD/LRR-repeat protein At5g22660-like [Triticum dicoccoides]